MMPLLFYRAEGGLLVSIFNNYIFIQNVTSSILFHVIIMITLTCPYSNFIHLCMYLVQIILILRDLDCFACTSTSLSFSCTNTPVS